MNIKKNTAITSSKRHLIQISNNNLRKKPLLKNKIKGLLNSSGRNNTGKVTIRHKGGGHKKNYRILNFNRTTESTGIVCSIEYDPNRNTNIASVFEMSNNTFFYIIAAENLKLGDIVKSGANIEPKLGYSLPISEIPIGSIIHNVALKASKPSKLSRAAGSFSCLKEKTLTNATIEVSSGEHKVISPKCYATLGVVSNELFFLTQLGKAGRSRWLNIRPSVRGVAMNPVDHPHGGGEGKKSGKGKTPWGKPTKRGSKNKIKTKTYF